MADNSEALREAFRHLPPIDGASFWDKKRQELRDKVASEPANRFLTWPTITSTMFVGNAPYIEAEFAALPQGNLLLDPGFGAPVLHWSGSSGNFIHQAYHLYQWQQKTGQSIGDMQSIVEFGAGYGVMALIAHRLGFAGQYYIYDLPEFALLQQYYLSNVLDDIRHITWSTRRRLLTCDLMIACHSLSEMPLDERRLDDIRAKSYLFVYHGEHEGVDNLTYFAEFAEGKPGYRWQQWATEYPANQFYMVGAEG